MLKLSAFAKINLTLEVLGRRSDGYHEIASVLQTIGLVDTLSFEESDEVRLQCSVPELVSPENLVVRAAKLLQETTGCRKGVSIYLSKGIPWEAGLGGGASDAAATLWALNELWGLGLPLDELIQGASRLGSDVPFFLHGGTALVEGRGEKVTPLPSLLPLWVLLMKPSVSTPQRKTATLYSNLRASHFTQGQFTKQIVSLLSAGTPVPSDALYNVFEDVGFNLFAGLADFRRRFFDWGAETVHLAGSGPTIFTLTPTRSQGEAICHRLKSEGLETYLVPTVDVASLLSNQSW